MTAVIVSSLTALLVILLKWYLDTTTQRRERRAERRAKMITKEDVQKDEFINNNLNELLQKIKANRIVIGIFHNGKYTLNNYSIKKHSFIYEVDDVNTKRIKESFKNIDIADFPCFMKRMLNKDTIIIDMPKIDSNAESFELLKSCANEYAFFKHLRVMFAVYMPIFDYLSDALIGFIGVQYTEDNYKEFFNNCDLSAPDCELKCKKTNCEKCNIEVIENTKNKIERLMQTNYKSEVAKLNKLNS